MKRLLIIVCIFSFYNNVLTGQKNFQRTEQIEIPSQKSYHTQKITNDVPVIDGDLQDETWNKVKWGGDFIQWEPYEKNDPTQQTAFKILYDDKNLYVAIRCFDTEPDEIVRRMSRRDGFEGDWVEINLDSYHDLRTAFSFNVSAAGVKGDEIITNNSNFDESWDPIWYVKTQIDEKGWTAEMRIPLSQLRFSKEEDQVWGLQFIRRDFRQNERDIWQYSPRNSDVWVSNFGELKGLKGLMPQKQLEIQPYVVGKLESFKKEEGNPFATGSDKKLTVGVDGKIGVTSDLTIDFTINPDFGQVEADPAALTLDGFQIFFQERRPFFIENKNIFDYRVTRAEAGGPFTRDNLFYSRRIGRSPHGYPNIEDYEYANIPDNTSILGAAKFSGKTKNGLSIGILESVTSKEFAQIDNKGERRKEIVEPLSNYFVGRLQKDYKEGNTIVGGMFTATNRELDNTNLDYLHQSAYTGGFDFTQFWKNRMYYFSLNAIASRVNGTTEAITNTQNAFYHNFQRPDAEHLSVDTTLTKLVGHGGTLKLGKANGNFKFDGGVTWRSPQLELNDLGFQRDADYLTHFLWGGYRVNKPFSIFNMWMINYNHWFSFDFGGRNTFQGWNVNTHATFKNNYRIGSGINWQPFQISNTDLRGGPSIRRGDSFNNWTYINTDRRKKIQFFMFMIHGWGYEDKNNGNFKVMKSELAFNHYEHLGLL